MNPLDALYTKKADKFAQRYFQRLQEVLKGIDVLAVERFIQIILKAREAGSTIFFIGNGGSAATASHFANDISIGTNSPDKPFRAVSLTDNIAILTALGNDSGYEEIFARQLQVAARPGDVLVAISASGNSANLLKAIHYAKTAGIWTVALTAFDGGKMRQLADDGIHVSTGQKEYGPAEDAHHILNHLISAYLVRLIKDKN